MPDESEWSSTFGQFGNRRWPPLDRRRDRRPARPSAFRLSCLSNGKALRARLTDYMFALLSSYVNWSSVSRSPIQLLCGRQVFARPGHERRARAGHLGKHRPLKLHTEFRLVNRSWLLSLQRNSVESSRKGDVVLDGPFLGAFGEWFLTETDVLEVRAYRAGMALATVAAVAATATAWVAAETRPSPVGLGQLPYGVVYEALYWTGVAGLGIALHYIHIYMRPLHRALQYLLGFGAVTSAISDIVVWSTSRDLYAHWVMAHPLGVLTGAGWVAAALTGVFFKEAFCFRRTEAFGLFVLVPLLMGGQLLGWWEGPQSDSGLMLSAVIASLMVLFSIRKMRQNVRDDLGDKSVFLYQQQRGL